MSLFDTHWIGLELEISFYKKIESRLGNQNRRHFEKLINHLYEKLERIRSEIEKISGKEASFFGRSRFVLLVKTSLEHATKEFIDWHSLFQPLILLLTHVSNPEVDRMIQAEPRGANTAITVVQNLREAFKAAKEQKPITKDSVRFPTGEHYWDQRKVIKYTSIQIHQIPNQRRALIIDTIPCNGLDRHAREIVYNVRRLAQVLRLVDPMTFGIPACAGLVHVKNSREILTKIEMVFEIPMELEKLQSLRDLLLSSNQANGPQFSIDARINLAKHLARIILYVHSADFVHKNFRPETIILLSSRNQQNEIGFPFLVGFQNVRLVSGDTVYMGNTAWEQNIYRHPERQGQYPEQSYKMQHDIYSLGVCLLEIALWKSFVLWDGEGKVPTRSAESIGLVSKTGWEVKDKLIAMAEERIPKSLGHRYATVTLSCLQCLDGSESWDSDGATVGIGYIEKVSLQTKIGWRGLS